MITDRVTGLNIYPLKSAHAATVNGEIPTSLSVGETGFEVNGVRDRDFVLYDPAENIFVSQRGWNAEQKLRHRGDKGLASVRLDIQADHIAVASKIGSLEIANEPARSGNRMTLDIFGKGLPVVEQDVDASRYFSTLLERDVLLVRSDRDHPRVLPEKYRRSDTFNQVAGADGYPFLMTSEASLDATQEHNGIAPNSVPSSSYRGNIIIAGQELGPFGEDYIGNGNRFTVGPIGMYVVKACMRCPIPNIDQETGEFAKVGGLKVLRGRSGTLPGDQEKGVFFGQNLIHANTGVVSVGDPVAVESLVADPNIAFRDH